MGYLACVYTFDQFNPLPLNFVSSYLPKKILSQVVPLLMKAIGWQGGSILALETLKRVVGAGNRARDALVAQGLK